MPSGAAANKVEKISRSCLYVPNSAWSKARASTSGMRNVPAKARARPVMRTSVGLRMESMGAGSAMGAPRARPADAGCLAAHDRAREASADADAGRLPEHATGNREQRVAGMAMRAGGVGEAGARGTAGVERVV